MNKSEELAKLLGIKSKIICDRTYCLEQECTECKSQRFLPDFTKTNNFIKWLDVLCRTNSPIHIEGKDIKAGINANLALYIDWIKSNLKYGKDTFNYKVVDKVRQQAQQTEWEY